MTGPATEPIDDHAADHTGDLADDLADTELWAGLRDRAADRNRERVAALRGLYEGWAVAGSIDDDGSRRARRLIHELVGSAGTFGYPEVSAVAEGLGAMVTPPDGADDVSGPDGAVDGAIDLTTLRTTLDRLTVLLDRPPTDDRDT